MGKELPKQFLSIAGKTVLEHTLAVFEKHPGIDEIALVVHPGYREKTEKILAGKAFRKITHILDGGKERYHSTLRALRAYRDRTCNLLIHDAVRPLVSARIIDDLLAALQHNRAAGAAIPEIDTVAEADPDTRQIRQILDRSRLFRMQTPQGFDREVLQRAFDKALADPAFTATDDCGVVKKYLPGEPVILIRGEISNIKLTWPEDLVWIEKRLTAWNEGVQDGLMS
jgi:2-C-methyl-D-erythritol 4-phosphate cytidylyltransferase